MIIGACGFGSTGSSVVTDYLREFGTIDVKDDLEFTWVYCLDGLIDLERAVMHPHSRTGDSIYAIKRYEELVKRRKHAYELHGLSAETFRQSAEKFIDAITTTKWYWYDNRIQSRYLSKYFLRNYMRRVVIPKLEQKRGYSVSCWPLEEVRLSINPENFYEAARIHVNELLSGMGVDMSKIVALDQPFSGNNPQASFPFFEDPYAVVVDRDPRDNFVFANTRLLGRNHFMPVQPVEDFIQYYRALRDNQPYKQTDDRVLHLQFEEMVYEYDATMEKLRSFLHLPENPNPKSVFDPALSIANTQVFRRYPQYADDIKKIEEKLPEYLFDFSKYESPDPNAKMFYGKSPLNKRK